MKKLAKLEKHHYNAMKWKIEGFDNHTIAKKLGRSIHTINSWFSVDDLFREEYAKMKEEMLDKARNTLMRNADRAAEKIVSTMEDVEVNNTQLSAARDILDRVGLKATVKTEVKMEGQMNNHHTIDLPLLDDPEAVEMFKKLFEKMSDKDAE